MKKITNPPIAWKPYSAEIVAEANLVVDTRNATKGIQSAKIVRC